MKDNSPLIKSGAWAKYHGSNPIIFGPKEHLQNLAKEKPALYAAIKKDFHDIKGNETMEKRGADRKPVLLAGIIHAVEGLPKETAMYFAENAGNELSRGVTDVHQDTWIWLSNEVMVYDFFKEYIPKEKRAKIIMWMNAHLGTYKDDEGGFHNSILAKILIYLRIAYATSAENPMANDLRDYAIKQLYEGRVIPIIKRFGAGGGWTECGWYTRASLVFIVQAMELARRVEGYDGFKKAEKFFYERMAYEIHQRYPSGWKTGCDRYPEEGDGLSAESVTSEYSRTLRNILAGYFKGTKLAKFTAAIDRKGSNAYSRMNDFLYNRTVDKPVKLDKLPMAHISKGIGRIYMRDSWKKDAAWMRFEVNPYFSMHHHLEAGNFEIFCKDPLIGESGSYDGWDTPHQINWYFRTIAHNCMLIKDPKEKWYRMRDGGNNKYANDGGQTEKRLWGIRCLVGWDTKAEEFDRGTITAYENKKDFVHISADCTKAYSPAKLKTWVRQIVFLRPGVFIIFDRVVSTDPSFKKTFVIHTIKKPQVKRDKIKIAYGKAKLYGQILLPNGFTAEAKEGYAYEGGNFERRINDYYLKAGMEIHKYENRWRVEVSPKNESCEDLFLHVFSVNKPVKARLIKTKLGIGVCLNSCKVVFIGKSGGFMEKNNRKTCFSNKVILNEYEE